MAVGKSISKQSNVEPDPLILRSLRRPESIIVKPLSLLGQYPVSVVTERLFNFSHCIHHKWAGLYDGFV